LLVYLVPYLIIGHDTLKEAAEGLLEGEPFNEHFLMSIATIGALCIGFLPGAETQFPEAVFVMLFFQVGELFEGYAEGKSRDSIAHLMEIKPDSATPELRSERSALPLGLSKKSPRMPYRYLHALRLVEMTGEGATQGRDDITLGEWFNRR
jgi:cation transport ATPase